MGRIKATLSEGASTPRVGASAPPKPRKPARPPVHPPATSTGRLERRCTSHTESGVTDRASKLVYRERSPADRGVLAMAAKIALRGGQVSPTEFIARWRPYCDAPRKLHRALRASPSQRSLAVTALVPCRTCPKCLAVKARLWRYRANAEIRATAQGGRRSWFVTLTYDQIHLAGVLAQVSADLDPQTRSRLVVAVAYRDVQLWLKRLRKGAKSIKARKGERAVYPPGKFRSFAIPEFGEQKGRLHWHVLIHECGMPIMSRQLDDTWRSFTKVRLVDPVNRGLGKYLTKYLTKGGILRPRASVRYGNPPALPALLPLRRSSASSPPPLALGFDVLEPFGDNQRSEKAPLKGVSEGTEKSEAFSVPSGSNATQSEGSA